MRKSLTVLFLNIWFVAGCQVGQSDSIAARNACYQAKLASLKNTELYKSVFKKFGDTVQAILSEREVFGVRGYAQSKVDDALFPSNDSTQCLLLVLQKPNEAKDIFGEARAIHGTLAGGQWKFDIGPNITFGRDNFETFKVNSFENIQKLARYWILSNGKSPDGCQIDEDFWFSQMNR